MEKELDTVAKYLKEHDFKLTNQRKKIIETVFASHEHFTADDLYDVLRAKGESISKATIYRTLSLLCESGLVESRDFGRGQLYYEHVLGHEHHDHLICVDCGKVVEFRNKDMEKLQVKVAKARGFQIESHSVRIFGRCKACR
jgi:Fur family ferric uptake transcriptional regulator